MEPRQLNRRGLIHQTRETGMMNHAPTTDWIMMRKKAQALLELAVFGSLFLMLLAILINYGLRYNYQQQINQSAFRNALKSAKESMNDHYPISVTYVTVQDKHIPDPSNPFGIGSVLPIAASSSVTQSFKLQHSPDFADELPVVKINVSGKELGPYTTAGFREEVDISPFKPYKEEDEYDVVSKYERIYGSALEICKDENCRERIATNDDDVQDRFYPPDYLTCLGRTCPGDESVQVEGCVCTGGWQIGRARWLDNCAGQIIDYDTAVQQCRKIIDKEVCRRECERTNSSYDPVDCKTICSYDMQVPDYCATEQCGTGACDDEDTKIHETDSAYHPKYTFTRLDQIFMGPDQTKVKATGLSQDSEKTITVNTVLEKQEESGIITVSNSNIIDKWEDKTERKVIYYDQATGQTKEEPVVTAFPQH